MKLNDLNNKHILAVDYGRKFTGLATFKPGRDPYPLMHGRLEFISDEKLVTSLLEVIEEEFIDHIVIGIPYFTDGKSSTMTKTVESFIELFKSRSPIPTFSVDETLTTFEAKERMKLDPRFNFEVDLTQIDALSATIILEVFLKSFSES